MSKKNQSKQDFIEKELADMNDTAGNLMESLRCKSAYRLYGELRTRAKLEGHLAYYVFGTFFQMNLAQKLLQYETVRERAVELIAIFEDEEQARKIEPSMDLEQYGSMIYSMGACAYEVLAEATGELDGFNSEGMQECLTGGIEVCHRIGKLSCVQCFREYACDIHTAADDYELARYHSNQVLKQDSDFPERGDRRWLACLRLAKMDLLEGKHESSRSRLEKATELANAKSVTDLIGAQISVMFERHTLDLLEGRDADERTLATLQLLPPREECPEYDLAVDSLAAIRLVKESDWEKAEALLIPWSRFLHQSKSITKWLENGVRLVAMTRLKGEPVQAKRLSTQYEEAATKANDWQTIRRLNQALDESLPVTPLGTVVKNSRSENSKIETESTELQPHSEAENTVLATLHSPLKGWLDELTLRVQSRIENGNAQTDAENDAAVIRDELLAKDRELFVNPEDIGRALYLVNFLITSDCERIEVWKWANALVSTHQDVGYLISLLARLGMTISMIDRLSAEMAREKAFTEFQKAKFSESKKPQDELNLEDDFDGKEDVLEDENLGGDLEDSVEDEQEADGQLDDDDLDVDDLDDDEFDEEEFDEDDDDFLLGVENPAFPSFEDFIKELASFSRRTREISDTAISNERLDQLVRKSLLIDSNSVNNNFRAAEVYEYIGRQGEAERCYARAFKLDRKRDDAALALSRIYSESERIQDALYVLDLCIREGGNSAELLFEAALKAHAQTQYELQVSFLQKLLENHKPIQWSYYYLSSGLLELKRPGEALDAIEKEVGLFQSQGLHIDSVRAAGYAQTGQSDKAIMQIKKALKHSLVKIHDLTISGISGAYERLIDAARTCPDEQAIQSLVEDRMLKAGIATESYFEQARSHEKPCDLYLFQCFVFQPLEYSWFQSDGCLANQMEWDAYIAQWGVLARDESEAEQIVLNWQRRCYTLEPEIMDVHMDDDLLHDRPGIAFQGARYPDVDDDEDEDDDEDDFDFGGDDEDHDRGGNDHDGFDNGGFGPVFDDRAPF